MAVRRPFLAWSQVSVHRDCVMLPLVQTRMTLPLHRVSAAVLLLLA